MTSIQSVTAYLSLGSNIRDRLEHLRAGLQALCGRGMSLRRTSSVYETEPVGPVAQDWFLNCVAEVSTTFAPLDLLHALQAIERDNGRERGVGQYIPQGPRTLDIDLLLYGDQKIDTPELTVPHPRMEERAFVLVPLCELAPALAIPASGRTVKEVLRRLEEQSSGAQRMRLFIKTLCA